MRSLVCEAPLRMKLVERPDPVAGPGEALVRIQRVGVCGTDFHAFQGNQPFLEYPRVLGHELSGVVSELPDSNSGLSTGDAVVVLPYLECGECVACRAGKPNCCVSIKVLGVHCDGGMQDLLAVPATHLLPATGLDADQAALVECLSIGAHAVRRAAVCESDSVLVIGAGPIGLGVVYFAKNAGARVVVSDRDDSRLRFVEDSIPGVETAKVDGAAFDVVFDVTGNRHSMSGAVELLVHGGRLVFVGLVKGEFSIDHPAFHKREATLLSSRNATREDFVTVMDAMRSSVIDTASLISQRVELEDVVDGMERWSQPGSGLIKTIVCV
jgi:2-desacetyl-2-hydroxyethyl bacteriochlorophyllide A dehydrogenase